MTKPLSFALMPCWHPKQKHGWIEGIKVKPKLCGISAFLVGNSNSDWGRGQERDVKSSIELNVGGCVNCDICTQHRPMEAASADSAKEF